MKITQITAVVLAGFIGIMSIISGSSVLLGFLEVGYRVLNEPVVYNVALGVLSVITAILIWKHVLLSKKNDIPDSYFSWICPGLSILLQ